MTRRVLGLVLLLFPAPLLALTGVVVDADGRPVAAAQVTIVGRAVTVRSDAAGRFEIRPAPTVPFSVLVVGPRGDVHAPVHVETLPADGVLTVRLETAFHDSTTVTAAPNIEAPAGAATSVVGSAELADTQPHHVAEALRRLPGVTIRGRGAPAVPVLRGLAGGRTLLLLDDIRVVTERRAGPSATFLDPVVLGSIEVARGPGSVAYGSDAFGGVVHARTRDPIRGDNETTLSLIQSFGGQNATRAAATTSFDVFGGAVMAAIHARSEGEQKSAGGERTPGSTYRDRGAVLVYRRENDWGNVRMVAGSNVARDVGVPSTSAARTFYPTEGAHRVAFDVDYFPHRISVQGGLATHRLVTTRVEQTGSATTDLSARDLSLRVTRDEYRGTTHFAYGIDTVSRFGLRATDERSGVREVSIRDASRIDSGLYGTFQTAIGRSILAGAGARLDAIATRNRGGFFADQSRDDVAPSGHFTLTAGPFRRFTTTLQIASGYREPSLSDRYFRGVSGRGFVVGNPDLEPERSIQLDGALRWEGRRATVAIFAYHYMIRDLVERYRATNDFRFRNRGAAIIEGTELEGTFRLPASLLLQIGGTIARGEDRDTGESLDDIAAPNMNLSLRWTGSRWSAWGAAAWWAADGRPGPVETSREAGTSLDLGAGWRISDRVELMTIVRNAADSSYFDSADAASALAPGRSVSLGVNTRF